MRGSAKACLRAHTLKSPRKGFNAHPEDSTFMVCSELLQGPQASGTAVCWVEEPGVDMPGSGKACLQIHTQAVYVLHRMSCKQAFSRLASGSTVQSPDAHSQHKRSWMLARHQNQDISCGLRCCTPVCTLCAAQQATDAHLHEGFTTRICLSTSHVAADALMQTLQRLWTWC